MPACKFSYLIVIHAQLGFGFLKALFNCPSQSAEPHERFQPCTGGCVADEKAILRLIFKRSPNQQPHGFLRKPCCRQNDLPTSILIDDRPFGAFGYFPAVPEIVVDIFGQLVHGDRFLSGKASTASINSGLTPYKQSANTYLKGNTFSLTTASSVSTAS